MANFDFSHVETKPQDTAEKLASWHIETMRESVKTLNDAFEKFDFTNTQPGKIFLLWKALNSAEVELASVLLDKGTVAKVVK